jgi:hypothetical protein
MWLWGLFLVLAGVAFVVDRRGRRFEAAVLLVFAVGTGVLGCVMFYGCSASAPYAMGLGATGAAASNVTTFTCLAQDAFPRAIGWTVFALSCSAALAAVAWGRRVKTAALRVCCYLGAAFLLLVAAGIAFGAFFAFSWCSSSRLF